MNSARIHVISMVAAVVSCIAAVLVVPEVRCAVGLPSSLPEGCRRRASAQGGVIRDYLPPAAAPSSAGGVEPSILRIRARFNQVEAAQAAGRLDSLRKEIAGLGGDSAYATLYLSSGEVAKIRARVFSGDVRTSYQAYYEDGDLDFVFRTVSRLLPTGPSEIEEQRFYFSGSNLIRWLDAAHREVPAGTGEYVDAEQRMRALGTGLLDGARSSDAVISFPPGTVP
jgi:hypothetical protein